MFTLFFTGTRVTNHDSAVTSDTQRFAKYFWGMIDRGIYLPCSQFEANFVSAAHSDADIDHVIASATEVMKTL
jgi:glutamate-1-semialdehyde 2,1-aminomutase